MKNLDKMFHFTLKDELDQAGECEIIQGFLNPRVPDELWKSKSAMDLENLLDASWKHFDNTYRKMIGFQENLFSDMETGPATRARRPSTSLGDIATDALEPKRRRLIDSIEDDQMETGDDSSMPKTKKRRPSRGRDISPTLLNSDIGPRGRRASRGRGRSTPGRDRGSYDLKQLEKHIGRSIQQNSEDGTMSATEETNVYKQKETAEAQKAREGRRQRRLTRAETTEAISNCETLTQQFVASLEANNFEVLDSFQQSKIITTLLNKIRPLQRDSNLGTSKK